MKIPEELGENKKIISVMATKVNNIIGSTCPVTLGVTTQ